VPLLTTRTFKLGLLLFWALYFSIVFITNWFDALKAAGVLGDGWKVTSGNWASIREATAIYDTPGWLRTILFAGVLVLELLAAALFWRAFLLARRSGIYGGSLITAPVIVGAALFAGFVLADEIFIAYSFEATHFRILIALVVSLLALRLLPSEDATPLERGQHG